MIIKSGLWLLSFVTALRIANTQLLISAGESIAANLVGHCPVLVYNDSKLSSLNELLQTDLDHINNHDLRVFAMSMNELEVQQYARLPKTLTWLNEKLALGIVDGQPKAQAWVDRKDTSWTITPDHPRSNKSQCMQLTKQAVAKPAALYDSSALQSQLVQPYLLHAKQAIIHDSGILALQCGYFQSHESCETKYKFIGRKWYKQCLSQIQTSKVIWQDIFGNSSNVHQNLCVPKRPTLRPTRKPTGKEGLLVNPNLQHEEKVFVITSNWDHNYHHFLFDSITRMVKYLPFLHSNPDIKIHSRRTEQFGHNVHNMYENSVALRKKILLLLGLDPSRLIFGTVAAKQVYYPRSMICNFPTTNALEIRKLANYLLEKAREVTAAKALVNGRSPFVVHQAATRNKELSEPKVNNKRK